ncbi:hypothetical protein N7513_009558 [Penicillium frequentans]|nr:hypothetical protein N7513_009558 [Penicillium glabrum]
MDDISALSTSCASGFDTLTQSLRTSSNEFRKQMMPMVIENEYARFKIWAGNLGALQRGRSSLDARLRDSVVLRAAVLKFLGQLQDTLSKSAEITTGLRLPYEQSADVTHDADEETEDNSDNSDSSSDISTGELAERLEELRDVMQHLYRLSFKIRNTRYRSLTKKALLMKEEDPQTGTDLFSAYAIFDRRHVQESLDHLRWHTSLKEFAAEAAKDTNHRFSDVSDDGHRLLDSDDFLRDRLAKAITNRRRYFAYWRRHGLKLSHVTDELAPLQNLTTLVKPVKPPFKSLFTPPISGNFTPAPGSKTMVSGTDFSMYRNGLEDQLDTETVTSYATTAYDINGKSPEMPPYPPDAVGKSEFVCPYCWVACPSRQGKGNSWQEHIRQDLQPYVCTYKNCPDADRMYASRHTWLEHERLVHRRIWKCFEHRSFISISQNGLLQHFLDCHKNLDGQQIENLLDLAEMTVANDRQKCPFCYSIGPFVKGFYNHLAFHQEQFATFAVPRNIEINEEAESGRVEGIRSAGSLRSVTLDFPEGDSSLHSDESGVPSNRVNNSLLDAAGFGDATAVRLLLDKGADVNAQGGGYGNALQAASVGDHEEMVQLLLEKGVDVNEQGGGYGNALQAASLGGHEEVVQLLLEKGADINAHGGEYSSALQAASVRGHEEVVHLLLEKGADVNAQGGLYGNALQAALLGNQEKVLQMLLDQGACVHTESEALDTFYKLGAFYSEQEKLDEAEQMYQRALAGYEKALGREHTSTLNTVTSFGNLYKDQGKLDLAEHMYQRALAGYEKTLGREHTSTLNTVTSLGNLYKDQGKLDLAEHMHKKALAGYEKTLGREHTSTLNTVTSLGNLYEDQGKLDLAEHMHKIALAGYEKTLGREHTSTLDAITSLRSFYKDQGRLKEAEEMYQRAPAGKGEDPRSRSQQDPAACKKIS